MFFFCWLTVVGFGYVMPSTAVCALCKRTQSVGCICDLTNVFVNKHHYQWDIRALFSRSIATWNNKTAQMHLLLSTGSRPSRRNIKHASIAETLPTHFNITFFRSITRLYDKFPTYPGSCLIEFLFSDDENMLNLYIFRGKMSVRLVDTLFTP